MQHGDGRKTRQDNDIIMNLTFHNESSMLCAMVVEPLQGQTPASMIQSTIGRTNTPFNLRTHELHFADVVSYLHWVHELAGYSIYQLVLMEPDHVFKTKNNKKVILRTIDITYFVLNEFANECGYSNMHNMIRDAFLISRQEMITTIQNKFAVDDITDVEKAVDAIAAVSYNSALVYDRIMTLYYTTRNPSIKLNKERFLGMGQTEENGEAIQLCL